MPTNRTPRSVDKRIRITAEVVALFRRAVDLQCDESSQHWEEDGGTRGAYHNARLALHHALGRKPWDRNVIDCFEADPLRETNQSLARRLPRGARTIQAT